MGTDPTTTTDERIRCASCGEPPAAAAPQEPAEPLTHCEWCGAEYPVPGAR